jgi:hypothetical protein
MLVIQLGQLQRARQLQPALAGVSISDHEASCQWLSCETSDLLAPCQQGQQQWHLWFGSGIATFFMDLKVFTKFGAIDLGPGEQFLWIDTLQNVILWWVNVQPKITRAHHLCDQRGGHCACVNSVPQESERGVLPLEHVPQGDPDGGEFTLKGLKLSITSTTSRENPRLRQTS